MELILYKCSDDKRQLTKTLTDALTLSGTLRDQSKIVTPEILIQQSPMGYNYCYIPEFERYYFINEITNVRSSAWIISLKVDVLMSFRTDILAMNGLVSQLADGNEYFEKDIDMDVRTIDSILEFDDSVFTSNGSYILIAQGGIS